MNMRAVLSAKPIGLAASATLAFGAVAALPAHLAFADPASTPSASVVDGTLTVTGTNAADDIAIGVGTDPSTFSVDLGTGAPPMSFARSSFTTIAVSLGLGDDRFAVDPHGGFSNIPLFVDGGGGNDRIGGSAGNDVLVGGTGDDTIRGGDGNDVIFSGAGNDNVDGERGADVEFLGAGDDSALWNPGEGSDIVYGGGDHDALVFNGNAANEKFALAADGSDAVLTRDVGNIRMDTFGVEELDLATLAGTDTVAVGDLTGTHLRQANLDLSAAGRPDGQLDSITVDGTDHADHVNVSADGSAVDVTGLHTQTRITGNDTRDQLHVATGDGNDRVDVGNDAAALIGVSVDLGADQH